MKTIFDKLSDLLNNDERLVSQDGLILKNQAQELARKNDPRLIKLLLTDVEIKKHFFFEIDKVLLFDKEKFIRFISNKQFLPDSYTAFKNKVGLAIGDNYLSENRDTVLVWPYKDCVLEGGMTKENQTRDEIFYNEILAPDEVNRLLDAKVFTNFKRIDKKGEQSLEEFNKNEKGNIRDNLVIKGNNLLTLASLKKNFAGKVKLIYIDPPYNTPGDANTFNYNNTFNHSTWLTFMRNRLSVAKTLLKNDGVLAIAIDDFEQAYLKVMCDEIFNRDNFIGTLVVQSKPGGRSNDSYLATSHEYVLFYSKVKDAPKINFFELSDNQKQQYKHGEGEESYKWRDFLRTGGYSTPEERPNSYYPIYYDPKENHISLTKAGKNYIEIYPIDSSGKKRVWRKVPESFKKHVKKGEIQIVKNKNGEWKVKIIDRIKEGVRPSSIWVDSKYDASSHGTKLLKKMFDDKKVFSFPKSLYAVQDVIEMFTEREGDDLVLDFFAGSGTTAEAVMNLNEDGGNRQFILCEQMLYIDTVTKERVKKVIESKGYGNFVYMELAMWNDVWAERIELAKTEKEITKLWDEINKTAFISYKIDAKTIDANMKEFKDLNINDQKIFLMECLEKNHLYVNFSEMNDKEYGISEEDKTLNNDFYNLK